MKDEKVRQFIGLAGQTPAGSLQIGTPEQRALGAQLLLSEVLEYIINGLGVTPECNGTKITDANALTYTPFGKPDPIEMVDGLADTAYTMYWNAVTFGVPLDEAYDLVCDNNLDKFVKLPDWHGRSGDIPRGGWGCGLGVSWPPEVVNVEAIQHGQHFYAVGKDKNGKVRKPSSYMPLNLDDFVKRAMHG